MLIDVFYVGCEGTVPTILFSRMRSTSLIPMLADPLCNKK
jgi:hypothetical protein